MISQFPHIPTPNNQSPETQALKGGSLTEAFYSRWPPTPAPGSNVVYVTLCSYHVATGT